MAERIKDAEDRLLESMFEAAPLADDGFSARAIGKIRRRLWLRRLILPVSAAIGGVIAFKPLAGLVASLASVSSALIPQEFVSVTTSSIPQFQTIVLGAMLLGVFLLGMRTLEE